MGIEAFYIAIDEQDVRVYPARGSWILSPPQRVVIINKRQSDYVSQKQREMYGFGQRGGLYVMTQSSVFFVDRKETGTANESDNKHDRQRHTDQCLAFREIRHTCSF